MNADEKWMDTDYRSCLAKHSNHPRSSEGIRVHHLQALQPCRTPGLDGVNNTLKAHI
jgi:hypothetical protein